METAKWPTVSLSAFYFIFIAAVCQEEVSESVRKVNDEYGRVQIIRNVKKWWYEEHSGVQGRPCCGQLLFPCYLTAWS
jgi:hypothetical protein